MNLTRKLSVAGLLVVVVSAVVACGSDDDGGGSAAKLASCKQLCDKSATAACAFTVPADICKEVCDAHAQASAACQDALKASSDCQLAAPDVCSPTGCEAQSNAYQQACGK